MRSTSGGDDEFHRRADARDCLRGVAWRRPVLFPRRDSHRRPRRKMGRHAAGRASRLVPRIEIGEPPARRRTPGPALARRPLLLSGATNPVGVGIRLRGPPNGSRPLRSLGPLRRCKQDSGLVQRVGRSLGAILAEQHAAIGEAEVTGWLPRRVAWPEENDWIRERLPSVVVDDDLVVVMERTIERYEAVAVDIADRVLVHGDVGLHNLVLDPGTDTVNGIFDY